jgi:NADPH-dependent 7-cyano-7-deazaguanine reductase QueF
VNGWYDSDFEIPASFTKGKDRVTVEIRYVASPQKNEINEFYYWIFSYK